MEDQDNDDDKDDNDNDDNVNEGYSTNICHHCAACSDPLTHQHFKMSDCRRFTQRKVEPKQTIDKHNNSRHANRMYHGTLSHVGSAASGIDFDCYSPSYHKSK